MESKEKWIGLSTKEKVFWVTVYSFITAVVLLLGALLAQLVGIAIIG